jgi:hypothetical protein
MRVHINIPWHNLRWIPLVPGNVFRFEVHWASVIALFLFALLHYIFEHFCLPLWIRLGLSALPFLLLRSQ